MLALHTIRREEIHGFLDSVAGDYSYIDHVGNRITRIVTQAQPCGAVPAEAYEEVQRWQAFRERQRELREADRMAEVRG